MAATAQCSASNIQACINGERDLRAAQYLRLANYYGSPPYGDLRLAQLAVPEEYEIVPAGEGTANGRVEDESDAFVRAMSDASVAFSEKDVEGMDEAIRCMEEILDDLKAERNRLKARQN